MVNDNTVVTQVKFSTIGQSSELGTKEANGDHDVKILMDLSSSASCNEADHFAVIFTSGQSADRIG